MITLRRNNVVKVVDSKEKAAKLLKEGFEIIENTESTGTTNENADTSETTSGNADILETASDNANTLDTISENADDESLDDIEKPSKKGKKNAKSGDTDS